MSKKARALVGAALTALYRKDDTATSDTFQVAFDTSAPMIQAVMGAFADAVFSQMERRDAQKAYHGSKRAMAGLVHGQVDRLLTAKRDHAVRKRVSQFQSSLDTFLDDLASKNDGDAEALRRRFYKKLLAKFSEAGLNIDTLSIDPTPATASTQGSSSMKVTAQIIAANKASLAGTVSRPETTTAAPAAPMPDWLKNMGRKGQQRYFAANPNSRYNPNRVARPAAAPKQGAAPAAAKGGHGAMIAKHLTPKNVGAVSSTVRKNASAGAAAATHILDDETKKGTVGALQKIQDGQELDGNDKKSLFKTAMIGAAGAALSGATLVGSALLAPVLMSDPNMVHGTLNHIIDSVKNSGASQNFSDAAEKVTSAAGEYIGKAGHFVSENAKDAAARAEKLLGPDTIQKLKDMKSSAGGAVDDATKWASSGLHDVHQKAHEMYDAHVQPHLDKIAGVAKDTADTVKDKAETGLSHVKHALRDAKEAVNPTPPASNDQVKDAIDKSGGAKPDYDAVTQKNTADPKLMDNDAPDQVQRHGGQNHPMSDADYTKKIGEATKDAPGYNDKAPTVTTKGPLDMVGDAVNDAVDSAKKFGSDAIDSGSKALDDVTNAAKEAHEHVKKAASDAITHMHKKATDAINDASKGGESMLDSVKKGANQLDSDIKTASKEFGDDLARKGKAGIDGVKKGVSDWLIDKGLKKVDIK